MFISNFDKSFGSIKSIASRKDDDWCGKLNHFYTVLILGACALIVTFKNYVGSSKIDCWTPAHFSGAWNEYANDYCWVRNTYKVAFDDRLPRPDNPDREYVVYYQWIPFYLLGQALLFYVPAMVWRAFNNKSGVELDSLVKNAIQYMNQDNWADPEKRQLFLDQTVTERIQRFLKFSKRVNRLDGQGAFAAQCTDCLKSCLTKFCFSCGRKYSSHLIYLYIVVKILMLINVVGQMFLMTVFLGSGYMYGFNAIAEFIDGSLTESVRFPRVTFCDFEVRRLGNVHRYTIQCALPINLFHEMIFMVLWFWFLSVVIMTAINIIGWFMKISEGDRMVFIRKQLLFRRQNKSLDSLDKEKVKNFLVKYLHHDGVFLLRLIYLNTDILTSSDIVMSLWEHYNGQRQDKVKERAKEELEKQDKKKLFRTLSAANALS